jgi:hypothetical protein
MAVRVQLLLSSWRHVVLLNLHAYCQGRHVQQGV